MFYNGEVVRMGGGYFQQGEWTCATTLPGAGGINLVLRIFTQKEALASLTPNVRLLSRELTFIFSTTGEDQRASTQLSGIKEPGLRAGSVGPTFNTQIAQFTLDEVKEKHLRTVR